MKTLRRLAQSLSVQIIVDAFIYISISVPVLVYIGGVKPRARGFFCDDQSLQYPYTGDSISTGVLLVTGLSSSLAVVILAEGTKWIQSRRHGVTFKSCLLLIVKGYISFLFGSMVDEGFVKGLKHSVGRLRPNFFDVCKPNFTNINCSQGYITDYVCTSNDVTPATLLTSKTSFPSGHASFSMFVAVFCALYLQERFKFQHSRFLRPVLQSGFVLMASLCAVSRVSDNMHHVTDVVFGSLIGLVIALFMFITVTKQILRSTGNHDLTQRSVSVIPDPLTPTPLLSQEAPWPCSDSKSDYNELRNGKLSV